MTKKLCHLAVLSLTLILSACGDSDSDSKSLTIKGSATAPATSLLQSFKPLSMLPETPVGDASSLSINMYKLYLSENEDCSEAEEYVDYGSGGEEKDFIAGDTLFSANPADGTYKCLIFKMSDVIKFKSEVASDNCEIGQEYEADIYRIDSEADGDDWVDVDLVATEGTGTQDNPVNDKPYTFFTTDAAAAVARGIHTNQIIELSAGLEVPGSATFYWSKTDAVTDDGVCGVSPQEIGFED